MVESVEIPGVARRGWGFAVMETETGRKGANGGARTSIYIYIYIYIKSERSVGCECTCVYIWLGLPLAK
jgi:hypothetical protein